ncbi:MAG: hypothetical protein DWQ01_19720 [Planctomycetota bacterium]|nr:MAG: hypothetical protein DWQ01_19720 [Planctomycetota bacterium]
MRILSLLFAWTVFLPILLPAQETESPAQRNRQAAPKIQWFGTWSQALAEAKRTGRPILLTSAAPQCRGVSGMW